ncbi:MAG: GtrA family protein [Alphaproteobacteria bacterium]|nr:GtrA family protein [Alphaproteobacteria bacterium]
MIQSLISRLSNPVFRAELKKLITYGLCGSMGVLTDLAIYTAMIKSGMDYPYAVIIGSAAGTLVSFLINRRVTFRMTDKTKRRMAMFFTVAAIGSAVSMGVIWVLVDMMHLTPIAAKVISLFFVFATQYTLNRLITFRSETASQ